MTNTTHSDKSSKVEDIIAKNNVRDIMSINVKALTGNLNGVNSTTCWELRSALGTFLQLTGRLLY